VYNDQNVFEKRTFQNFKRKAYDKHQKWTTPLVDAEIDCINLVVFEHMHLICLGVVKRILRFLKNGPRECKLSANQITLMS